MQAAELHLQHILFKATTKTSTSCFRQQAICPTLKREAASCCKEQQMCVKVMLIFCILLVVGEQKKAAIDNAPTCFRSMLLLFGIETAIENLIQAFSLEK